MVSETIGEDVWAFIFLMAVTVFLYLGHAKSILLVELVAFCALLAGSVWAFTLLPWYIPMLFVVGNLVIFVTDVVRK